MDNTENNARKIGEADESAEYVYKSWSGYIPPKNVRALLGLLLKIPADLDGARELLESGRVSADEVSEAGYFYVEECYIDCEDVCSAERYIKAEVVPERHSTYLYDVISLLLEFGLDPNAVINTSGGGHYDDDNIMFNLRYIDNEYIGADTLDLLLEHGGDPFLKVDGEELYTEFADDAVCDADELYNRRLYDATIHCWFVLLARGANHPGEVNPIYIYPKCICEGFEDREFTFADLKNHRNYTYGITNVETYRPYSIHIFDKITGWEVARV